MRSLIKYSLYDFLRSHKYFPPISTFIIFIFVFYAYKPNPIIDSYAATGIIVYIVSAWLCISIFSLDAPVQRQLMILHIGSKNRYYLAKLLSVWFVSLILTFYALIYPIVFGMFNESVSLTIGLVSLLNHIILSILGVSVASLFSKVITESAINSYGGLALTIIISIAALGVYDALPTHLKNIVWIIPPATITQKPLFHWNGERILELSFFPFIWILVYALILIYFFLKLAKRLEK